MGATERWFILHFKEKHVTLQYCLRVRIIALVYS